MSLLCALVAVPALLAADESPAARLREYEDALSRDAENLTLACEYRQASIGAGDYERPIALFEKLARRKGSGANVQISLALALVDKAPTVGEVRRTYIGFDAMNALTKAISQQPSTLAYYIRGRINLDYDRLMFHRTDRGVADLEQALKLVTPSTPPAMIGRIYLFLGDGYYKLDNLAKARAAWTAGADASPGDPALAARLETAGTALRDMVHDALAPSRRVDTSFAALMGR